jgi:hypothetical protein
LSRIASKALTTLKGGASWSWIADEPSSLEDYRGASSIKQGMLDCLGIARLDRWQGWGRFFRPKADL